MQSDYAESFVREMGCTADELLAWLPGACGERPLTLKRDAAEVAIDAGALTLAWQPLPARRIALITLPRLQVAFRFSGLDAAARQRFMRYFDLYTQRGGG